MRERADVENRLRWTNAFWEAGLLLATVDMRDPEPLSGEPGRMEDHEASAIGHEIGLRRRNGVEDEHAIARPADAGFVFKPLIVVGA